MNNPITQLHIIPDINGMNSNRMFRVFFYPDKEHEHFEIGQDFKVISVNRITGEVQLSLDMVTYNMPPDDNQ